jgi:hypothetical protein
MYIYIPGSIYIYIYISKAALQHYIYRDRSKAEKRCIYIYRSKHTGVKHMYVCIYIKVKKE